MLIALTLTLTNRSLSPYACPYAVCAQCDEVLVLYTVDVCLNVLHIDPVYV